VTPQFSHDVGAACSDCSFTDLQADAGLKDRVDFLKTHLEPLLLEGAIECTIPDMPRSSTQKYRSTENGRKALRKG
jgi:hypothetical protein